MTFALVLCAGFSVLALAHLFPKPRQIMLRLIAMTFIAVAACIALFCQSR